MCLQAHVIDNQLPGCAEPEEEALMHQHACSCAAAEFEVCIAKKEAAVADAAVAAVAKVGLRLFLMCQPYNCIPKTDASSTGNLNLQNSSMNGIRHSLITLHL